jgi:diguanylate cyclase (GGDEF)-like protein/PAS domain S-box-containing protein
MVSLLISMNKAIRRHWLPALVFAAGLGASAYGYVAGSRSNEAKQLAALRETAENYEFLMKHRLDLYASVSRDLGAFFSASQEVDAGEFDNYSKSSRLFERLNGLNSFGYLPRVAKGQAQRFEAHAAREFPGFRIRATRKDSDAYFPLLRGQHATDAQRYNHLRGIDYSAIPERWEAMQEAEARDEPVTTRRHTALGDARKTPIVMIFSPVRQLGPDRGETAGPRGDLKGFIFSTIYVERLFRGFDDGRLARLFDLEVFEDKVARDNLIFDADKMPHALDDESAHVLAHRAEVQFANRKWLLYFYAKKDSFGAEPAHTGTMVFAIGLLLTAIATYACVLWPRHLLRKRVMRDFGERFAGFFENHPFAVYALDPQRRFLQVNQQMAKEIGMPRESLIGVSVDTFLSTEARGASVRQFAEVLAGNAVAYTNQLTDASGRNSDLSIVMIPMSAGDTTGYVLCFAENITERKKAERELYESRQMLQLIIDNIPQSVFWKDINSVYQGGNRSLLDDAGLQGIDELIGKTDADFRWRDLAEHYRKVDMEVMGSGLPRMRMQATDVRRDGTDCWIETSKIPLQDGQGKVVGVLAVTEDITARKYMEQELFRRANHDALTGLPNRGYFQTRLEEAVKRAQRREGLALMYFDIDRFKLINDTYGHDMGDEVIRMFAERVRAMLRETDFMARLGGDEFVLIAEGLSRRGDTVVIAQKLVEAMWPAFNVGGTVLQVSTSIGVAYFEAGMTPDELLKAADQAMYDAKRAGRNCFRQAELPAEKLAQ